MFECNTFHAGRRVPQREALDSISVNTLSRKHGSAMCNAEGSKAVTEWRRNQYIN